jgi:hypothetical protein
MTLKEIADEFHSLKVHEVRKQSDGYLEYVVHTKDIQQWETVVAGVLGAPVKTAGETPSMKDTGLCSRYGGILKEQVLFHKEFGALTIIAMFWPWKNNQYTTLKIAVYQLSHNTTA